jgi:Uma2 family endonuclease
MTALPSDFLRPPAGGWTLADLEQLPEGARVEVLGGTLVVNPSPLPLHQRMVRRLAAQLEGALPAAWQLEADVDLMLNDDPLDYLAPDIVVFDSQVPLTTRPIKAADVLLVVEVVSRWSRREDRGSKPLAYAEAGVEWYWRVESPLSGGERTELHASRLDVASGCYRESGRYTGAVHLEAPFALALDLDRLD